MAGFQARLEEMLRSRQAQLQRLNEELDAQVGKRAQLEERKSGLRGIRKRILLLKRNLCRMDLQFALDDEELGRYEHRAEQLQQEQRDVASEVSELQKSQTECDLSAIRAFDQDLQKTAQELESMLRNLELLHENGMKREEELALCKEAMAVELQKNRWLEAQLERQVQDVKQWMKRVDEQQEELQWLQLENESVEKQVLQLMGK